MKTVINEWETHFILHMSSSMWNYTYLFSFWVLSSSVVLSIYFSGTAVIHSFVLFNSHSSGMHCPDCMSHICLQTTSLHVQWKLWFEFKKRDLTSLSSLIFWQANLPLIGYPQDVFPNFTDLPITVWLVDVIILCFLDCFQVIFILASGVHV